MKELINKRAKLSTDSLTVGPHSVTIVNMDITGILIRKTSDNKVMFIPWHRIHYIEPEA